VEPARLQRGAEPGRRGWRAGQGRRAILRLEGPPPRRGPLVHGPLHAGRRHL